MTPTLTILEGDVLARLRDLPDQSVQTCITSPPYWGLRDYKIKKSKWPDGWKGCLGLESSPELFVKHIVMVFAEVRRVLRDDGTLWVNLGDSYTDSGRGKDSGSTLQGSRDNQAESRKVRMRETARTGLMPKNLVGIPWRVAFALQADGWHLRSDIIWHKPNPMPESVRDRPTKAHEYLFLFSKKKRYFYDYKAICEPVSPNTHLRVSQNVAEQLGSERAHGGAKKNGNMKAVVARRPSGWATSGSKQAVDWASVQHRGRGKMAGANSRMHVTRDVAHETRPKYNASFARATAGNVDERNKRSVWTVPTFAFDEAHYATFPPELIRPCIQAGSRKGDVVLDPFLGSGTTAMVSLQEGRNAVGIEMSPDNVAMAHRRCTASELDRQRMLYQHQALAPLPLFGGTD